MRQKPQGGKSMDTTTLVLAVATAILLLVAFRQGRDVPLSGLQAGGRTLWRNLPLLLLGFAVAGLVQVLLPRELISRWLGAEAGAKGILIGCVAGGLVPGAPYAACNRSGGIGIPW
jgi:ABC-type amino acid transport system permease subunit